MILIIVQSKKNPNNQKDNSEVWQVLPNSFSTDMETQNLLKSQNYRISIYELENPANNLFDLFLDTSNKMAITAKFPDGSIKQLKLIKSLK